MANVWRIFVVEDDEILNQNIVNTLRKEGYVAQGVLYGADAVRALWSDEYDVVIGDLKMPDAGGFELLQWLRAYRPNTYMILIGDAPLPQMQSRALESGATSYLEKPLDLRLLKEELRRLLQQTGFSANLDSFDLLDVIQMITMSHRSIALLVNTGLEERGLLRFRMGELIWAEYGMLRGEEAFFALAAHKNGSVVQQPWNGGGMTNVTQPLSRLIFQALQYRTKYANMQEYPGEPEPDVAGPLSFDEIDDTPFIFAQDAPEVSSPHYTPAQEAAGQDTTNDDRGQIREWWENTGNLNAVQPKRGDDTSFSLPGDGAILPDHLSPPAAFGASLPPTIQKTPTNSGPALPSWLTDQPTDSALRAVRSSAFPQANSVPNTPTLASSSPAWQSLSPPADVDGLSPTSSKGRAANPGYALPPLSEQPSQGGTQQRPEQKLDNTSTMRGTNGANTRGRAQEDTPAQGLQQLARQGYNYPALVSALQTLGYSIPGFVAAAVVSIDGQPIAQVAVEDVDIAQVCRPLSNTLRGIAQLLTQEAWGDCEQVVVTSSTRHVLIHLVGETAGAFQMLVTAREADPKQCMEIMANVEGAIAAALT